MSDKHKNKKYQGKSKNQKGDEKNVKDDVKGKDIRKQRNDSISHKDKHCSSSTARMVAAEEPVDTLALFANLKRETDEILKISEGNKSKYSKREITSNWTKYELPVDNYDLVQQTEHGADFEELLHMPVSQGGHFQFKHEKTWKSDDKIKDFKDLFTFNINFISSGLSCVPFYQRNNLDPELFNKDHVARMDSTAAKNMEKFTKNLPTNKVHKPVTERSQIYISSIDSSCEDEVVDKRMEMCEDDAIDDELEKMLVSDFTKNSISENSDVKINANEDGSMYDITTDDLGAAPKSSVLDFSISDEQIKSVKSTEHKKQIDNDDELDEILGLKPAENEVVVGKHPPKLEVSPPKPNTDENIPKIVKETKVDLDKWLDDYLDS